MVLKLQARLLRVSLLFFLLWGAHEIRPPIIPQEDIKVYPDPYSRYFTLGYGEALADSVFIKLLLNMDYCENEKPQDRLSTGLNLDNILETQLPPSLCHLGWAYQWTDFLTELAPEFKTPYALFGTSLSVLVEDREGARRIFEKGLLKFPKDWTLNYRASYHYLYEVQDADRAAHLMLTAAQNGGPAYLVGLASQLYTRLGQKAFARSFLESFIEENPEIEESEHLQRRLQQIQ